MTRTVAEPKYEETISFSKVEPGTAWEGKYVDVRSVPTKNGRVANVYTIKNGDGPVEFWGVTAFDRRMAIVPPGSYVWITYAGKVPTAAGTQRHEVRVEYDPDPAARQDEIPF